MRFTTGLEPTSDSSSRSVSLVDEDEANWVPNIERATVTDPLGVIYSTGPPGEANEDIVFSVYVNRTR